MSDERIFLLVRVLGGSISKKNKGFFKNS